MKNIEFIVLTCDLYLDTRVKSIKNTWGKNVNIKYLSDTPLEEKNIIGYNTQKNYNGIYDKYYNFFKKNDFTKFDYYFFVDDDTFVNLNNLSKLYLPSKNEAFFTGRLLCLNENGTDLWGNQTGTNVKQIYGENVQLPLYYTSGGSGFIISQNGCLLIQNYLNKVNNPPKCIFGDVSVGFWCRNSGVKLIPNDNFWWDTHEKLLSNSWEKYYTDINSITYHYVNEQMMPIYHEKYNCL